MRAYEHLRVELDSWDAAGLTAALWWRDDDAVTDTPRLRQLLGIARDAGVVIGLAVVPERAAGSLVPLVSAGHCCVWQHGWGHHFHAAGEFGAERDIELLVRDALLGQRALDRVFGPAGWQRVFVPPNHMLAVPFKSLLPGLGYLGVSAGVPLTPRLEYVAEVNAEIDVMDWPAGRLLPESTIIGMLVSELRRRRRGEAPPDRPLGLLTHHLVFDDDAWEVTRRLVEALRSHHAVAFRPADAMFAPERPVSQHASEVVAPSSEAGSPPDISVVLTSCGRPDLLARTLDTFFAHNTCVLSDFIVMEDREDVSSLSGEERYRNRNIRWLCTGRRLGQMAAIDVAYRAVRTKYIFHCEDDWEFYAPGFIERSLSILERHPHILQVWLRALDDTNRHPVTEQVFHAGDVPYRLLQPGFDSGEWGTWHGFSFNPALRRRADVDLIGSFGNLDPSRQKPSWEIERVASEFYVRRGFLAATLADRDGRGYVRHIGWGRRVGEPRDE